MAVISHSFGIWHVKCTFLYINLIGIRRIGDNVGIPLLECLKVLARAQLYVAQITRGCYFNYKAELNRY